MPKIGDRMAVVDPMHTARAALVGVSERHLQRPQELRLVADGDGNYTFTGLASATEVGYPMHDIYGEYTEIVEAGAFETTLSENPKVILNVNHAGLALASTKAKPTPTLRVWESDRGLEVQALLVASMPRVQDIAPGIERGDIDEMSFAFRVVRQSWSPDYLERRIKEVNLHRGDVAIVGYGANPHTETSIRDQSAAAAVLDVQRRRERLFGQLAEDTRRRMERLTCTQ